MAHPGTTYVVAPDSESRAHVFELLEHASTIAQKSPSDADKSFLPPKTVESTSCIDVQRKRRKRRLKINPTPKNIIGVCLRRMTQETIFVKKRISQFLNNLPSNERSGADADLIDNYLDQMFGALVRAPSIDETEVRLS